MKRRVLPAVVLCLCCGAVLLGLGGPVPTTGAATPYHSPAALALSPDGKTLYAADQTGDRVAVVNTATGAVTGTIAVREPRGLVLSPEGKTLYVSSGVEDRVYRADTASRKLAGFVAAGRQPAGLAITADGKTLYCCNQFSNDVIVYDTAKFARKARLRAEREPRYLALTQGDKLLAVANHLPVGSNLNDDLGARLTLIDLTSGQNTTVQLSRGATDVGQVCCSPDGKYAYVTHVLARWLVPPTQLERGWMSTNALTIIDLQKKERVNTVLLDDLDRGSANPWGLALSAKGDLLYSTHAGGNELQIIDTAKLHKLVSEWPADSLTALEDDLTAVYRAGVRQRVQTGGVGPRAVVAAADGAYVANYFSGNVTKLAAADGKVTQTITLGTQPPADKLRNGEMLFNSSTVCFQGWQSCATCHPDGRADALAWDLMNDGLGNPKNAKSLVLSEQTPPVMAHGVRANMGVAVTAGYKGILFHVPTAQELADTSAYLSSVRPVRSPLRKADGSLSDAAKRGKAIFERRDVGCAVCHPAPLFSDLRTYDVGTRSQYDTDNEFDTPTLVEMFRTAPYLHDGGAVTMREVLKERNAKDQHGKTSQLSDRELDDLAEYVLSL